MRRVVLASFAVIALVPSGASGRPQDCSSHAIDPVHLACGMSLVARHRPHVEFVPSGHHVSRYVSRWAVGDREFLTGEEHGCTTFGRWGPLRVREITCDGHHMQIAYRSVDGPIPVTFEYQVLKRIR